jgi:DNA-binding CsgD family transcriptional regulator
MPKAYKLRKNKRKSKTVILGHLELFYLRLYAHGLNTNEIADFLDVDQIKVNQIRYNITAKYNTKNWVKILGKAFKNNVLQQQDFISTVIKQIALQHTQLIYEQYFLPTSSSISNNQLKQNIIAFYYTCEVKLSDEYDKKKNDEKLTSQELRFVKLKYNNLSPEAIYKRLSISHSEEKLRSLKRSVFKKLEANNWYNAFKKAMQLNLLDEPKSHSINLESEVATCCNKIIRINNLKRLLDSEKKLSIYNELLELYTNVEFSKLITNAEESI